jgi:hypothetical protein
MSFASLKQNRSKSLEKLSGQLDKLASKGYSDPLKEKYWNPTRDAAGNGFAIIRFLPAAEGEDVPFVRIWDHGFQHNGQWYIEKSLTTLGADDPVSKYNSQLWNTGLDSDKELARKQKRRLKFHANIMVIKDSGNPENEGKVFLYAFGKKVFDKLSDLMTPQFEDETPVNPFDFWEGSNFKLKIRMVEGYPNYDKSEFDDPSPFCNGEDDKLEEVYKQLNSLQELIGPANFKTYEELEARLHRVLGIGETTHAGRDNTAESITDEALDMSKLGGSTETAEIKTSNSSEIASSTDDDDLEFFKNLAAD